MSKPNQNTQVVADADLSVMPDFRRAQAEPKTPWWRIGIKQRGDIFPNSEQAYFLRALRSVAAFRCILVLGALAIESYSVTYLRNPPQVLWPLGIAYVIFSILLLLAAFKLNKVRVLQALVGLGVDWLASIALFGFAGGGIASGGIAPGNAMLLVWPVLQAGVLGSGYLALLVALAQACFLSAHASVHAAGLISGESISVLYAVLVSLSLVAIGWLSQQLASRLNMQEQERVTAELRARRLEAVNRLSLEELDDGVFVADLNGRVETANPAALRMLGLIDRALPTPLIARADLTPLAEAFAYAVQTGSEQDQRVSWTRRGVEHVALVQCRVTKAEGQDAVVVFMRDAVRIAQQVHEVKLAGMGRLVAGIAHDIRNPLSAISQAAQLLREQHRDAELLSSGSAVIGTGERLAGMILTHTERINDTIEDVLVLGRKPREIAAEIELAVWLQDWAEEQRSLGRAGALKLRLDGLGAMESTPLFVLDTGSTERHVSTRLRFHQDHLRRIINNLFDNALRYCSGIAGSIVLSLKKLPHEQALELVLSNDGPPIEEPLRSQLFEPFMSGESRGTGLGLYICRELCQQNGAGLSYRLSAGHTDQGEFVVRLPLATAAGG